MKPTRSENHLSSEPGLRLRMRSEERRITSQHRQLDELFSRVQASLAEAGAHKALGDFVLFATALEAHMSVEEDIYFPALHGLRADTADELTELVAEHAELKKSLERIHAELEEDDVEAAGPGLDELADFVDRHEAREERLIALITDGPVSGLGHTTLES